MKHMIFAIAVWVAITPSEQAAADTMQPLALGPVTIVIEAESTLLLIDPTGDQSQSGLLGDPTLSS